MKSIMFPNHHLIFCDILEEYREYEERCYADIGLIRPNFSDRPNMTECITHAFAYIARRREFVGGGE